MNVLFIEYSYTFNLLAYIPIDNIIKFAKNSKNAFKALQFLVLNIIKLRFTLFANWYNIFGAIFCKCLRSQKAATIYIDDIALIADNNELLGGFFNEING